MILKHIQFTKSSIAVAFLLLSFYLSAATITVDAPDGAVNGTDGLCSISEAIQSANTDTAVNECVAGSGDDTLELNNDITLTAAFENDAKIGSTGTPAISSPIIINGRGFSVVRDANLSCDTNNANDAGEFRLMRTEASSNLSLNDITFSNGCAEGNGNANRGGVILNIGTLSIDNSIFSVNSADNGGVIFNNGTITTIQNSIFSENFARNVGGGIHNRGTIITIQNSTFSGNSTTLGGGIFNDPGNISTVQNSTFSGNSASQGGGIYNISTINTIQNSTFSGNSAVTDGAGIRNFIGTINTLRNTLFHQNTGGGTECANSGTLNGNNNLSDDAASDCPDVSTLTTATVGPLADNGGPTLTHALMPISEAIDAGDGDSTTSDQRGINAFGIRDIGAYELNPLVLCSIALQTDGFTTTVSTADELNQAIECANLNGDANGGDTINLGNDITYVDAFEDNSTYGRTATPTVTTPLIINGNGFTLERDGDLNCNFNNVSDAEEFRILRISVSGDLSLTHITLANGCLDADFFAGFQLVNGSALHNSGELSITDSSIVNNKTNGFGSVFNEATISLINNATFSVNSALDGGGLYNRGTIFTIQNSTFSGNAADGFGGGLNNSEIITLIQNSTFLGNTAISSGGGITDLGTQSINLNNILFVNNSADGANPDCQGASTGSNNLSDNALSSCPGLLAATLTASTVGALADNGGSTMTHALLPGSEALDIGVNGTASDQRGFTASGIRDIGAFEAQPPMVVAPADVTAVSTGPLTSPALGSATVTDADDPGLVATASQTADFPVGMTTVTWSATDSYGFVGTDTQAINILATVGGNVTGLAAGNSVEIQNNGGDNLILNADGSFTFATPLALNDTYNVTVLTQPMAPAQTCTVSSGSGTITITTSNITSIVINCATNTYTIGGTVSGLAMGNSVTLQNNAGDDLTVNNNSSFTFATPLADESNYTVTIAQQPANQTCVLNNGSGTLAGSDVADVEVNCADNSISLSTDSIDYGSIFTGTQASNTVTVTNTGTSDVTITVLTEPAAPFSIIGGSCTGLPFTLMAGMSCEINVQFSPDVEGDFDSSFQIISNATSSPNTVNLSGSSGIAAVVPVPTLSQWALIIMLLLILGVAIQKRQQLN